MKTSMSQRNVLVTGCGGDLGSALCRALQTIPNLRVVGTTRSSRLEQTKKKFEATQGYGKSLVVEPLDFDSTDLKRGLQALERKYGFFDTLINNAGVILISSIEDFNLEKTKEIMKVNFFSPMQICSHFLKDMKKEGRGTIINVSSACTFVSLPTHGLYAASKASLEAATRAMSLETRGTGVSVYCVQPGLINNGAYNKAMHVSRSSGKVYKLVESILQNCRSKVGPSSKKVANKIVQIIEEKPSRLELQVTSDSVFLFSVHEFISSRFIFTVLYSSSRMIGYLNRLKKKIFFGSPEPEFDLQLY